jgi:Fic family protein
MNKATPVNNMPRSIGSQVCRTQPRYGLLETRVQDGDDRAHRDDEPVLLAVHPFLDGNGRVGRLLITLFLIERKILPTPLPYLSAFFEASRRAYYDGLRGISERGAWNGWLEYFLLGVARMSEDALSRAMRINGLLADWQKRASGESSNNPLRVVELLGANPFITTKGVADKLATAFTTGQRAIERLERSRIVKRVGNAKRDRVYCATALLDILEEPARLKPPDK